MGSENPLFIVIGLFHPGSDSAEGWVVNCLDASSLQKVKEETMKAESVELPVAVSDDGTPTIVVHHYPGLRWSELAPDTVKATVVDVSRYGERVVVGGWFFYGVSNPIPQGTRLTLPAKNGPILYRGCPSQREGCPPDTHARLMGSLSHLQTFFVEQ